MKAYQHEYSINLQVDHSQAFRYHPHSNFYEAVAVTFAQQDIIDICVRLHQNGWLAACDGNVSVRLSQDEILITPPGRAKAFLCPRDISVMGLDGVARLNEASSEKLMHLAIYNHCLKAKAVIHAHPPIAVGWSIAKPHLKELPANCISELILAVGAVPIVPYARPGTKDMGSVLIPYLPESRVMILAKHGALVWGESLEEAFMGIERLEHTARTLMYAHMLGGLHDLPAEEVDFIRTKRKSLGEKIL